MEVKSLFDTTAYTDTVRRLNNLSASSQRHWGKMDVSQMLAHCKQAFKVPLSDQRMPRMFFGRLIGWMVKHKLYDSVPWKQGLPTAADFVIKDQREFEKEKAALLELVDQFHTNGPAGVGNYPHPFFGQFTKEQWGKMMWKHLDHHLRQFGV